MDAVKFVEERNRMCKSFGDKCKECPAFKACEDDFCCAVGQLSKLDAMSQVALVKDWADAHPRKTRQRVFLEQYPEADLSTGTVNVCPNILYSGKCDCTRYQNCLSCKREFWMQEVE